MNSKEIKFFRGLPNLFGSTCYINSSIQCLRHLPEFRKILLNQNSVFSKTLNSLFQELDNFSTGKQKIENFLDIIFQTKRVLNKQNFFSVLITFF